MKLCLGLKNSMSDHLFRNNVMKSSRPKKISDVSHQEEVISTLRTSIEQGSVFHCQRRFICASCLTCCFTDLQERVRQVPFWLCAMNYMGMLVFVESNAIDPR